jgi:predicted DNA binding CopG/RHH family protein
MAVQYPKVLGTRVTSKEFDRFKKAAEKAGLSQSQFLRKLLEPVIGE